MDKKKCKIIIMEILFNFWLFVIVKYACILVDSKLNVIRYFDRTFDVFLLNFVKLNSVMLCILILSFIVIIIKKQNRLKRLKYFCLIVSIIEFYILSFVNTINIQLESLDYNTIIYCIIGTIIAYIMCALQINFVNSKSNRDKKILVFLISTSITLMSIMLFTGIQSLDYNNERNYMENMPYMPYSNPGYMDI